MQVLDEINTIFLLHPLVVPCEQSSLPPLGVHLTWATLFKPMILNKQPSGSHWCRPKDSIDHDLSRSPSQRSWHRGGVEDNPNSGQTKKGDTTSQAPRWSHIWLSFIGRRRDHRTKTRRNIIFSVGCRWSRRRDKDKDLALTEAPHALRWWQIASPEWGHDVEILLLTVDAPLPHHNQPTPRLDLTTTRATRDYTSTPDHNSPTPPTPEGTRKQGEPATMDAVGGNPNHFFLSGAISIGKTHPKLKCMRSSA